MDALAVAQQFTAGGVARDQEIAKARTETAALDTRLATQIAGARTEVANLETRLIRWILRLLA